MRSSSPFLFLLPLMVLPSGLSAQPSSQATIVNRAIEKHKPGDPPLGIYLTEQGSHGSGNGIKARGDSAAQVKDLRIQSPVASVGPGVANAGGGGTSGDISAVSSRVNWFVVGGVAALLLGAYFQWMLPVKNRDGSIAKAPDGTPIKGNPHLARFCWIAGGCALAYGLAAPLVWIAIIGGVALTVVYAALAVTHPALLATARRGFETARTMAEGAAKMGSEAFQEWRANAESSATEPADIPTMHDIIQSDRLHEQASAVARAAKP